MFGTGRQRAGAVAVAALISIWPSAPVQAQQPTCFGQPATIIAVAGEPTIGTAGADVIIGTPGDDVIYGGDGDDLICGRDGADVIRGNRGDDRARGGRGPDLMVGGDGNDLLIGGRGHDDLRGKSGNDILRGWAGRDQISGGPDDDTIHGGGHDDILSGGRGSDVVIGAKGDDTIFGGDAADVLRGWSGNDTLAGDQGDDILAGNAGDDALWGGPGTDLCNGGAGTDTTTACESQTVSVFFSTGDGIDCGVVSGFNRVVAIEDDPIRAAFDELVGGPTPEEEALGASAFFSATTAGDVRSVVLDGSRLVVDFEDFRSELTNASTSCGSEALLAQLNATAFQFPEVETVRYEIEGSCDVFMNWLQRDCTEFTRAN